MEQGDVGKYFKRIRERHYFLETENMEILKITLREQGNMAEYFYGTREHGTHTGINTQGLIPTYQTNSHGPIDVRAIYVWPYKSN